MKWWEKLVLQHRRRWALWLAIRQNYRPMLRKYRQLRHLARQDATPAVLLQRQKLRRELLFLLETEQQHFASFGELTQSSLVLGRFSVMHRGLRFDCMFRKQEGEQLFVVLSGLRTPNRHPIPKFDRLTFTEYFPGSVLYISDPCHYLDGSKPQTAWYLGTEVHDGMSAMVDIVRHIAVELGVSTRQIIPYGSSAGGFAAVRLAAALGDSTAVAINWQTRLWEIQPQKIFTQFIQTCFPHLKHAGHEQLADSRFDAIAAIEASPQMRCLYVQNTEDRFHWQQYFLPFCRHFGLQAPLSGVVRASRLELLVYSHPTGHGGEPRELAPEIIARAVALSLLD